MSGVGTMCIFLRGNTNVPPGLFLGDGVRCCATLLRIGQKMITGTTGTASGTAMLGFAGSPSQNVQTLGLTPLCANFIAYYQVYYRNPNPTFCSPYTFNITNAYSITW